MAPGTSCLRHWQSPPATTPKLVPVNPIASLSPSFPFRPLFGGPVPPMPSLFSPSCTHNYLSSQVTEDFHRTVRRVWPRFQPKFCPRCGDRSRQEGQARTRTLSGVKGTAPSAVPNEGDIVIPDGSFFPRPRPTRRRTYMSVRFGTGSVPSPLFLQYLSPPSSSSSLFFEALGAISRFSFGDR